LQRVYKRKTTTLIYHLLIAVVAVVFVFVIARSITHTLWIAGLIAFAVLFAAVGLILSGAKLKIIVDDTKVTFIEKRKTTCHEIATCSFSSKITDGTDFSLTVYDGDESYYYDCSYIGSEQYNSLLDALGVTGEKQKVQKIETRKGE